MARADRHKPKKKRSGGRFKVFIVVLALSALALLGVIGLKIWVDRTVLDKDGMENPNAAEIETQAGHGGGAVNAPQGGESSDGGKQGGEAANGAQTGGNGPSETSGTGGTTGQSGAPASGDPQPAPEPTLIERAAQMQDYTLGENGKAAPVSVQDDNILLLINKTHPLSADYWPDDMVKIERNDPQVGTAEVKQMREVAAGPLNDMMEAAAQAGYNIVLRNAFRSYKYQESLFASYVKNNGEAAANRYSARPGESEHQTGLCADVGVPGKGLTSFNGSKEAAWMAEHAHEFGFILRFPEGKEDITGYMFESWHFRYVGIEAATEIYERGITLEEYLEVTY